MTAPGVNTLWARAFTDELARVGVRDVVVAPGSRSTPLVMAFAADERFRMRVHLDERSAGFFALGVGKASGVPAVVVSTSGTAAANLFPSVVEAAQSEVPLLVLTADRPNHFRDADANQAIDQLRLFGTFARAFFEVALPRADGPSLRHLRALAARAVASAVGAPAGPVHLNFPFEKPLEPADPAASFERAHPLAALGREGAAPFVSVARGTDTASPETVDALVVALDSGRGVVVAGPSRDPERAGAAALALAARTGFPLLADPLSGARYGPDRGAGRVGAYDLFLRDPDVRGTLVPSVVLRIGASPTSAALQSWLLDHNGVRHIVVDDGARWKDHGGTATDYVHADAPSTLAALTERSQSRAAPAWRDAWIGAEDAARAVIAAEEGPQHEGSLWEHVIAVAPEGGTVFVSSSMPVRDLDSFGAPRDLPLRVLGNRGASGIDGVVSTAFGVASQTPDPVIAVIGDVAFFHDQNGLLWSRERDAVVVFVLVDNDGGGIFHMLPIAGHEPEFTEYFATPHGLDFVHAAALHGLELEDVTLDGLAAPLADALGRGRTTVLRVRTDRSESHRLRLEVVQAVTRSVRNVLGLTARA